MYSDEFHGCCGAVILNGFKNNTDFGFDDEDYDQEAVWEKENNEIKYKVKNILDYHGNVNIFSILDGVQKKHLHGSMLDNDFNLITTLYNPKHNSVLFLYIREPVPEKNPKHKDFRTKFKVEDIDKDGYLRVEKKKQ